MYWCNLEMTNNKYFAVSVMWWDDLKLLCVSHLLSANSEVVILSKWDPFYSSLVNQDSSMLSTYAVRLFCVVVCIANPVGNGAPQPVLLKSQQLMGHLKHHRVMFAEKHMCFPGDMCLALHGSNMSEPRSAGQRSYDIRDIRNNHTT